MVMHLLCRVKRAITRGVLAVRQHLAASTKPTNSSLVRGSLQDLARTKPQLIAENALLRQQLIVLNRSVKRPCLTATDRSLLVLLASRVRAWKDALLIVKPDTLLRWHRQGFRLFWRRWAELSKIAGPQFFTDNEAVARGFAGEKGFVIALDVAGEIR